jgi:fatty-acyl-CoA synthase
MSASRVTSHDPFAGHPSASRRSVCSLLDRWAAEASEEAALSFPASESSYAELRDSSIEAARRMRAGGVEPGDRVAILLREASEPYVAHGLAAMRLGAICVPVNARNKTHELAYVLGHSSPRLLLTEPSFGELLESAGLPDGCRAVVLGEEGEFAAAGAGVPAAEVAELEEAVGRDDPALLLYTSGTTANPKGCLHTHASLLAEGENCSGRIGLEAGERFWTPLAMFHVGGWQVLMSALTRGACASHVGFFEAGTALDQLEREHCTHAFPAFELIWLQVLEHPRFPEADLSALRVVINVGVPERMRRMQELLPHVSQVSCLGMTESCGSLCIGQGADSLHSRTHTSGHLLPGMEVRVLDPISGEEQPPGQPGEMLFRGVTSFAGYYRDPDTTAAIVDDDGWVRTGDLVRREEDGTIAFVSRLKDMLKVGGENVSAAEIEGYLITHPDVSVAAVVGAPDARYGEVPAAFVQLTGGASVEEEDLIRYCIGNIATFKVPRYIRFLDEFPATATAKIQKFVLRERIESELRERGISEAPKLATRP